MQEIEFTKEDEYCIKNFGYNEVKDYEDLKQLEDEKHLIVEELEYRLQQKENIIKEVREYIEKMNYDNPDTDFELEVNTILGNALEILDKGE